MRQSQPVSNPTKARFYVDLVNIVPLLILVASGLVLQIEYHMHRLPDEVLTAGLSRAGWLLLHKIAATVALAGVSAHCFLHRSFFLTVTRKITRHRSFASVPASYYLLLLCIPLCLTAIASWMFIDSAGARTALVEIHDKLALVFIVFSAIHVIPRIRWMKKTFQKLA